MYEYFAYWNGATMAQFFSYVAALFGSGDFNTLMRSVAVLGLIVAMSGAVMRFKGEEAGKWLLALALFESVLIVPKVTVRVTDVRAVSSTNVANVPLGLALVATEMSHIGKYLTDSYETLFGGANDVGKFSKFGLAGPQRMMRAAMRANAVDPILRTSLNEFINQCVIPELADNPTKLSTIYNGANPWAQVTDAAFLNSARMVTLTMVAAPNTFYCSGSGVTAVTQLNTMFTNGLTSLLKQVGVNSVPDSLGGATGWTSTTLNTTVSTALGASDTILLGSSRSAETILKDAVMFNQLKTASAEMADGTLTTFAVSQANMASEINYSTMARIAESVLPQIRTGIEAMIVAIFPIMVVILVLTGHNGGMVLKSYILMAAWIQLWPPLYSVVNALTMARDGSAYATAVASLGGTTPAAMAWIGEMGASSQNTAGMFALAVPMIALAIIKGGEQAFASLSSSIVGPAASAAQSAGSSLASGNVQAGNASWGNVMTRNTNSGNTNTGGFNSGGVKGGSSVDWGTSTVLPGAGSTETGLAKIWNVPNSYGGSSPGSMEAHKSSGALTFGTTSNGQLTNGQTSSKYGQSGESAYSGRDFSLQTAFQSMNSGSLAHALQQAFGLQSSSGSSANFGQGFNKQSGAVWGAESGRSGGITDSAGVNAGVGGQVGLHGGRGHNYSQTTDLGGGTPGGGGGSQRPGSAVVPFDPNGPGPNVGPVKETRSASMPSGSGGASLSGGFTSGTIVQANESGGFKITGSDGRSINVSGQQMQQALKSISETSSDGSTRTAAHQASAALTRSSVANHGNRIDTGSGERAERSTGYSSGSSAAFNVDRTGELNDRLAAGGMSSAQIQSVQAFSSNSPHYAAAMAILGGQGGGFVGQMTSPDALANGGAQPLQQPKTPEQIREGGGRNVSAATPQNEAGVVAQNRQDNAKFNASNPSGTTANAAPVNNGATASADAAMQAAAQRQAAETQRTNMATGAAAISASLRSEEGGTPAQSVLTSLATAGLSRYSQSDFSRDAAVVMERAPTSSAAIALGNLGAGKAQRGGIPPDLLAQTAKMVKQEASKHQ